MTDNTPIQSKDRFKKIILKQDTNAYYLDKNGNLVLKGTLKKGKVLKVDSMDAKKVGDQNVFRVLNVRHSNVYIPCTNGNADYLTKQYIKDLAKASIKKYFGSGDAEISETQDVGAKYLEAYLNSQMDLDAHEADSLSTYEEKAFSSADGFSFAGHLDEAFEKKKAPSPIVPVQEKKNNTVQEPARVEGRAFRY
jgi:hypothetical protein